MNRIMLGMWGAWMAAGAAVTAQEAGPRSFAYVLQAERLAKTRAEVVERLAGCGRDWIVLDRSFEAGEGGAWTAGETAAIRAGKEGRKVLVYLSIGEAEDYRDYWRKAWDGNRDGKPDAGAPSWLCAENPDWEGNYKVRPGFELNGDDAEAVEVGEVEAEAVRLRAGFELLVSSFPLGG